MATTWKANVEEAATAVAEGTFDAEVTGVQDMDGQHGPMVRIEFTLSTDDEWDERRVTGLASKKLSENTKLGRWVAAILGHVPEVGEEVSAQDLVAKGCRVVVKHKTNADGKVFANVVQVLRHSD
ncbi:MAG: hypothetical protein WC655_24540 [Candidatus Hydrogenedentales bacterium]|jgi:hypothetical protein